MRVRGPGTGPRTCPTAFRIRAARATPHARALPPPPPPTPPPRLQPQGTRSRRKRVGGEEGDGWGTP